MSNATASGGAGERQSRALLSFSLGPVQSFVAAARTTRDLWSGSFILSWLVYRAMRPVIESCGAEAIEFPDISSHPYTRAPERASISTLLSPSIPNLFVAEVSAASAAALARACEDGCRAEVRSMSHAVRLAYRELVVDAELEWNDAWDERWDDQVANFFEIRTAVLPCESTSEAELERLLATETQEAPSDRRWKLERQLLAGLLQARRGVRHLPACRLTSAGPPAGKCSLLGSFEQIGPASSANDFWAKLAASRGYHGTRFSRADRLCAVSIVKRLAWPAYIVEAVRGLSQRKAAELNQAVMRVRDTATVAAAGWLGAVGIDPAETDNWTGHWLHWPTQQSPDEEEPAPPDRVWERIVAGRRSRYRDGEGWPPAYYAVLVMDGDRIGDYLRGLDRAEERALSGRMADFATNTVPMLVREAGGQPVYSGGDDALALLPAHAAVACAQRLNRAFGELGAGLTLSAGMAIVHFKQDLRFAIEAARQAESEAKRECRNILNLTICRRSGEHTSVLIPWTECARFQELVGAFRDDLTDRWTYIFRQELPALAALTNEHALRELTRLAQRTSDQETERIGRGGSARTLPDWLRVAFSGYGSALEAQLSGRTAAVDERVLASHPVDDGFAERFVHFCQSASFLARGTD